MACESCDWRYYRRIDEVMWPVLLMVVPVAVVIAVVMRQPWWLAAAVGSFGFAFAGRKLGGLYWWGGHRCRRCGATEQLR